MSAMEIGIPHGSGNSADVDREIPDSRTLSHIARIQMGMGFTDVFIKVMLRVEPSIAGFKLVGMCGRVPNMLIKGVLAAELPVTLLAVEWLLFCRHLISIAFKAA
ncbi:hypothetical protein N7508_004914 [Penicillium antarcticum]|uniref:uncharacterized protein n=1 Tax=Penicillium antarcticum TaxID=416450 RepID=UPI00238C3C9C|nr:uncharacterized protein N7508_004914 [Penicillium antarcticum]KAJ5305899.1 hypothetical protein N7508_004914 [Penicillium antarcticum]